MKNKLVLLLTVILIAVTSIGAQPCNIKNSRIYVVSDSSSVSVESVAKMDTAVTIEAFVSGSGDLELRVPAIVEHYRRQVHYRYKIEDGYPSHVRPRKRDLDEIEVTIMLPFYSRHGEHIVVEENRTLRADITYNFKRDKRTVVKIPFFEWEGRCLKLSK